MTDLHTQYQTLIRRGMPECPGFSLIADAGILAYRAIDVSTEEWRTQEARDLITMHALRWVTKGRGRGFHKYAGRMISESASWHPDEGNYRVRGRLCELFNKKHYRYENDPDAILEAILAATEPLD